MNLEIEATWLERGINRLRDALGDSAEDPCFIETLAGRGYRFIRIAESTCRHAPSWRNGHFTKIRRSTEFLPRRKLREA